MRRNSHKYIFLDRFKSNQAWDASIALQQDNKSALHLH